MCHLPALTVRTGKRLLAMVLLLCASSIWAGPRELRNELTVSVAPREGAQLGASAGSADWTWLTLRSSASLRHLPADWQLIVDQARFASVAVVLVRRDGTVTSFQLDADQVRHNWALGGRFNFTIATPGAEISRLYLGFRSLDSLRLMRSVQATTFGEFEQQQQRWLLLMGVYVGALLSALVYNASLYLKQRQGFQLWYLAWVSAALAYGVCWTNVGAFVNPALAGPVAVRADYVLVALAVALGSTFFLSIVEQGKVTDRLKTSVRGAAAACLALGAIAANERAFDAVQTDRLLNLSMLISVGLCLIAIARAWARGSRVARVFVIGWTPVILAFAARSARNFGLADQSDLVDMATFAAIAFEALMFSLAVANRFADLREERDKAAEQARQLTVEAQVLRRAAQVDHLTGLANRSVFYPHLNALIAARTMFALYLIDVDYLKELNDREGHHCGDAALAYLGSRLKELANPHTCVARIGGDEFAIVADGPGRDHTHIHDLLGAVQGGRWAWEGYSGRLSLSVGSFDCADPTSAQDAMRHADIALYHAKNSGRGMHCTFDDDLRRLNAIRAEAVPQAWAGLQRGEFVLHFQPIFDLRTNELVSMEALVRWQHPERGLLAPSVFLELLHEDGIGPALQERIIALAIQALQLRERSCTIAVNFTAMDLRGEAAAERLLARLAEAGVAPSALCVEVTEGILLDRSAHEPISALRALHAAGVTISLDDFGTGYASLVHLKTVPVDTLKIDRSFISGLLDDAGENEQIVAAIIALGHGLGKTVVAEGIETLPQLKKLQAMGCDYGQGFLLGRPGDSTEVGAIHLGDLRIVA